MFAGIVGGVALAAITKQTQAEKKLEAVIRATGGAAGFTADELKRMASQLQLVTNYGDEVTISAIAILTTFKQIKGDAFRDAVVAMQDMSAVMGTGLKESAVQLGKALNDPIKGISALSRVGVSFSEQQKQQIKGYQESNQLMKAQGVILAELKGEFGGAAREMADPLVQLKNDLGDIAEIIGSALVPKVRELGKIVRGAALAFAEKDSKLRENVLTLGKWALAVSGIILIVPRLLKLLTMLLTAIKMITGAQTVMLALSGPKGWAVLAAGALIAVGAIAGLEMAWIKVAEAARDAKAASEEAVDSAGKAGRKQKVFMVSEELAPFVDRARQAARIGIMPREVLAPGVLGILQEEQPELMANLQGKAREVIARRGAEREERLKRQVEQFEKRFAAKEGKVAELARVNEWEGRRGELGRIEARIKEIKDLYMLKVPETKPGFQAAFESAEQMYRRITIAAAGRAEDPQKEIAEAVKIANEKHELELRHLEGIKNAVEAQLAEIVGRKPVEAEIVGAK
jgi:hypothetical protein